MLNYIDAVYQSSIDRVIAFATGDDGQLIYAYADGAGGWSWGTGLPGIPPVSSPYSLIMIYPSATYNPTTDQVMAFVTGNDFNLYRAYWDGSGWEWDVPGMPTGTSINFNDVCNTVKAIYIPSTDQVLAFAVGGDYQLHLTYQVGTTWSWISLPALSVPIQYGPVAVYQAGSDSIWVWVVGTDGNLYSFYSPADLATTTGWITSPWGNPGHNAVSVPATVYQSASNDVHVFIQCADGNLYRTDSNNTGPGWIAHGSPSGTLAGTYLLSAVYQSETNHIHVFVVCKNNKLYDFYGNGAVWSWDIHPTPHASPPLALTTITAAVYQPSLDRVYAFGQIDDNGPMAILYTSFRWRWSELS